MYMHNLRDLALVVCGKFVSSGILLPSKRWHLKIWNWYSSLSKKTLNCSYRIPGLYKAGQISDHMDYISSSFRAFCVTTIEKISIVEQIWADYELLCYTVSHHCCVLLNCVLLNPCCAGGVEIFFKPHIM